MKLFIILTIFGCLAQHTFGYNIMFFHTMGTKSHLLQMFPLIEKLLQDGNQVTAVVFRSMILPTQRHRQTQTMKDKNNTCNILLLRAE